MNFDTNVIGPTNANMMGGVTSLQEGGGGGSSGPATFKP